MEQIEKAGYDPTASLILTEPAEGAALNREPERTVKTGAMLAVISR